MMAMAADGSHKQPIFLNLKAVQADAGNN